MSLGASCWVTGEAELVESRSEHWVQRAGRQSAEMEHGFHVWQPSSCQNEGQGLRRSWGIDDGEIAASRLWKGGQENLNRRIGNMSKKKTKLMPVSFYLFGAYNQTWYLQFTCYNFIYFTNFNTQHLFSYLAQLVNHLMGEFQKLPRSESKHNTTASKRKSLFWFWKHTNALHVTDSHWVVWGCNGANCDELDLRWWVGWNHRTVKTLQNKQQQHLSWFHICVDNDWINMIFNVTVECGSY